MKSVTTRLALLFAALSVPLAPSARAELFYHIDGEAGSTLAIGSRNYTATGSITVPDYTTNYTLPLYTFTQDNNANGIEQNTVNKFGFVVNPDGDFDDPVIITGTAFRGTGALQFGYPDFKHPDGSGRSSPPNNTNAQGLSVDAADKVMIAFAPHYNAFGTEHTWNPNAVQKRDIGRYVGFAVYIPTVETMPVANSRWTILYQAFQLGTEGRPPFAVTIRRGDGAQQANTVQVSLGLRDDDDPESIQQTSPNDEESTIRMETVTLKRGVWYSFVIYQLPSSTPDIGRLTVWMAEGELPPLDSPACNSCRVLDYEGAWGYPRRPDDSDDRDLFSGQLGLYSNEHAAASRVLFDEIKFATTYDEANPCTVPASKKPTLTGFTPMGAPENLLLPDQTITITGANFVEPAAIYFGKFPAASTTVVDAGTIIATVPATLTSGSDYIYLYNSGWSAKSVDVYNAAYLPVPGTRITDQAVVAGNGVSLYANIQNTMPTTVRWEMSTNGGATWFNAVGSKYVVSDDGSTLSILDAQPYMSGLRFRYIATNTVGADVNAITLNVAPAVFDNPAAVTSDADGNLYVADSAQHAIYKIIQSATTSTISSTVTLFAGLPGTSGTADGIGTDARFNTPTGIAINPVTGLLEIADSGNNAIRTLTAAGEAATFVTFEKPAALAIDSAGITYVVDAENHIVRKVTLDGGVTTYAGVITVSGTADGNGATAQFNTPSGVAVGADNYVYVADTQNSTIRIIAPDRTVSTYAGYAGQPGSDDGDLAEALFTNPVGLAIDAHGTLYVTDTGNNTIREIRSGTATTIAGAPAGLDVPSEVSFQDGINENAWFNRPAGITLSASGTHLYVADSGNAAIRQIDKNSAVTTPALTLQAYSTSTTPPTPPTSPIGGSNGGGGSISLLYIFAIGVLCILRNRSALI